MSGAASSLEVRARRINYLGWLPVNHSYVVYTDQDGNRQTLEGEPSGLGFPRLLGTITGSPRRYVPSQDDVKPNGPSPVPIAAGAQADQTWQSMVSTAHQIENAQTTYNPFGNNSNSFVHTLLTNCAPEQADAKPDAWTPGWSRTLPLGEGQGAGVNDESGADGTEDTGSTDAGMGGLQPSWPSDSGTDNGGGEEDNNGDGSDIVGVNPYGEDNTNHPLPSNIDDDTYNPPPLDVDPYDDEGGGSNGIESNPPALDTNPDLPDINPNWDGSAPSNDESNIDDSFAVPVSSDTTPSTDDTGGDGDDSSGGEGGGDDGGDGGGDA